MNFSDAAIIYFACGAPAAVYHFLNQKGEQRVRGLRQALFVFLAWPLYLVSLIRDKIPRNGSRIYSNRNVIPDSIRERKLLEIRSDLEKAIGEGSAEQAAVLGEALERYCGLADALRLQGADSLEESQIFIVSGHENGELATLCLMRRNRSRLIRHHRMARAELLRVLADYNDRIRCRNEAVELFQFLDDEEGLLLINEKPQTLTDLSVPSLGNEVWSSKAAKASAARQA